MAPLAIPGISGTPFCAPALAGEVYQRPGTERAQGITSTAA